MGLFYSNVQYINNDESIYKRYHMELRHMRYVIAVAEELHFGRAAARLHIAQPPLSQQIRQLEEELGAPLFNRTSRRVELTDAGQAFLTEARRTLAQAERAVQAAQRAHRGELGHLEVGFVSSAMAGFMPDILRTFRAQFPDVDLVLHQLLTSEQVRALRERRLHIGFLRPPLDDDTLRWETVLREPLVVLLPSAHELAHRTQIPLAALADDQFVLPPHSPPFGLRDQVVNLCQQAGFTPRVTQVVTHYPAIVGFVAAGLGLSILPASMQMLQQSGVIYRPLQDCTLWREMAVAWRRDEASTVLQSFLAVVRSLATSHAKSC